MPGMGLYPAARLKVVEKRITRGCRDFAHGLSGPVRFSRRVIIPRNQGPAGSEFFGCHFARVFFIMYLTS